MFDDLHPSHKFDIVVDENFLQKPNDKLGCPKCDEADGVNCDPSGGLCGKEEVSDDRKE